MANLRYIYLTIPLAIVFQEFGHSIPNFIILFPNYFKNLWSKFNICFRQRALHMLCQTADWRFAEVFFFGFIQFHQVSIQIFFYIFAPMNSPFRDLFWNSFGISDIVHGISTTVPPIISAWVFHRVIAGIQHGNFSRGFPDMFPISIYSKLLQEFLLLLFRDSFPTVFSGF